MKRAPYKTMSIERLASFLQYDPETGIIVWKIKRKRGEPGKRAGWSIPLGYRYITVDNRNYPEHRIAWALMTGEWPAQEVDHINLAKGDNRWCNLRAATPSQNCANRPCRSDSLTGLKGVSRRAGASRWRAGIWRKIDGRHRYIVIGWYDTPEEANTAFLAASLKFHGHFARAA